MSSQINSGSDRSGVVVGVLLLLLAGILWYDAEHLGRTVAYGIGPSMMPKVIGTGLSILGALSILQGLRSTEEKPGAFDVKAVVIIALGFLALTVIIGFGGGFLIAMTVLFAVTSYAFGRRSPVTDVVLGFVLALLTYLLFSKLLALTLPQGPIERLLG